MKIQFAHMSHKQQDEWILTEMVLDCDRNCDLGQ